MTPRLDPLLRELHSLERRRRGGMPHHAFRGSEWSDDWQARLNRVERVQGALFMSGPTAIRILAERLPGIDLGAIAEILLSACKDMALVWGGSVLLGGTAGAAVGFFFGGVGAVPGAVAGAGLGVQAGTWVLGVLGLASLAEDLVEAVPQALAHYERGIRMAWGPVKAWDTRDDMHRAHHELAEGHIVLMTAILAALSAYLTRGRGDPAARARVLAEIRQSPRLGPKMADWLGAQEERLIAHPAIKPRQHQVMMTAAPARDAGPPVSPSQLRQLKGGGKEPDAPPPPRKPPDPRLPQTRVPCFHPYDKDKFPTLSPPEQREYLEEMAKQLRRQEDAINSMTADKFAEGRQAYRDLLGRNPEAAAKQEAFRDDFSKRMFESIRDGLRRADYGNAEAARIAEERTGEVMKTLNALHEPDMVAGGQLNPDVYRMGRADVNQSIGPSWNRSGRLAAMDNAADKAIHAGNGNAKMNVKLEVCRGKGLR
jgi:hypothetical protein